MCSAQQPFRCFLSFADSRMSVALNRIKKQAEEMGYFDEIRIYDEKKLDADFYKKHAHILKPNIRGYGYWCWKPYIILKTLQELPENSTLFYCDAGCHLNANARERLIYYYEEMEHSSLKLKAFPALSSIIDNSERRWTKGAIFDYFDCRNNRNITHSAQMAAGHIICRKNTDNISFFEKWLSVWEACPELINDSKSKTPNFSGFIENRHDQSIFSVLYKLHGGTPLPDGETAYNNAPLKHLYPIWDARDYGVDCRDMRIIARAKRFLKARYIFSKIKLELFKQKHPKLAALFSREN